MKKTIWLYILALAGYSNFSYAGITDSTGAESSKYKNAFVVIPAIGHTPNTDWFFTASGNYLFKLNGQDSTTRTSNFNLYLIYTLENQILIWCDYKFFFNKEKYILSGDIGFVSFPQVYYGIGNNTSDVNKEDFSYNALFIKQILSQKIISDLFVKVGYDYYNVFNVVRKKNGLLDLIERPAAYDGGVASGIVLGMGYDSRNNVLNSSKGIFLNFKSTFYSKMLGSGFVFQSYILDARKYHKLFKTREDVIAFQGYGLFNFGEIPFPLMAKLGGDMIMRGYYNGRYRDNHLLAIQAEYRLHLWKRIGIVGFAGLGDVADEIRKFNLNDIKYSYGLGFRFKVIKKENLNIRIDYGITSISGNFYITISEAF